MKHQGLIDFFAVLDLLKDPAKYEQKINSLKQEIDTYTKVVESVVELSKVNEYTLSIQDREEKSKQLLAEAKTKATELVAKATKSLEQKEAQLSSELQKVSEKHSALVEKEKQLEALEKEQKAVQKELDLQKTAYDKKHQEVQALKADFEEKLAKLKAII